jgi:hypothetical protein
MSKVVGGKQWWERSSLLVQNTWGTWGAGQSSQVSSSSSVGFGFLFGFGLIGQLAFLIFGHICSLVRRGFESISHRFEQLHQSIMIHQSRRICLSSPQKWSLGIVPLLRRPTQFANPVDLGRVPFYSLFLGTVFLMKGRSLNSLSLSLSFSLSLSLSLRILCALNRYRMSVSISMR